MKKKLLAIAMAVGLFLGLTAAPAQAAPMKQCYDVKSCTLSIPAPYFCAAGKKIKATFSVSVNTNDTVGTAVGTVRKEHYSQYAPYTWANTNWNGTTKTIYTAFQGSNYAKFTFDTNVNYSNSQVFITLGCWTP